MASQPPRWQAFLAELKRRRVFRVMAVYGAVGFVVLQAVDLVIPVLLLPAWTYRLIGLVLLAGFPVAIALAWVFELTPEGVRRTDTAHPEELATIVAAPRHQRWPAGLLALAGTVLLLAGGWFALRGNGADKSATAPGTNPSIAVLPFNNLARSEDAEPFVEGVHDDLLTQLSKIGGIKVISRTSVQEYRGTKKKIREIAVELGVNYVLEGGVQRAGDQVRMNVQLIDGRTDEHVWADTYNRTMTMANVFAIQSEIADAIARAVGAQLSPEERQSMATRPTESVDAYDHYQRGMAFFRRTLVATDVRAAIREFEAALQIDPQLADGWARLAIARLTLSWDFGLTEEAPAAEAAIRRAEALAPDRVLTHLARGYYHYYGRRDYGAALDAFAKAEVLSPGDPDILLPAGWVLRRQGRWDDALTKFQSAFARDPRNWDNVNASLGESLLALRRYPEAERYFELAASIAPDLAASYSHLALLHIMKGDTAAAAAAVERGAQRADLARILFDFAVVSRALAPRFGARLRATTSAISSQSTGPLTQWLGQDLTPLAFFLQKAHMLRALGADAAARAHFDSARVVLEPLASRIPGTIITSSQGSLETGLGMAYAGLGRKQDAIRYGRQGLTAIVRVGDALTEPLRHADLAEIYVTVGEYDLALDEVERLLAKPGWVSAGSLGVDPLWAPLRSHARFKKLLEEASTQTAK